MRQLLQAALTILFLIFLPATESKAKDKITLNDGISISGDIVSIDTLKVKIKYYPQDKIGWILRTFDIKSIKKISYNNLEYDSDKTSIEKLIKIFDRKENPKNLKPRIINRDLALVT